MKRKISKEFFLFEQTPLLLAGVSLVAMTVSTAHAQNEMEAEAFDVQSGTQLVQQGAAVGYINAGDYFGFNNYELPASFDSIEVDLAVDPNASNSNDAIVLTWGGRFGLKLAYLYPQSTGGWNNYETQTFPAGALRAAYAGNTGSLFF